MQLKLKLDDEERRKVLRKLVKYELKICKTIMGPVELAAALNTVLTHFAKKKK